MLFFDNFLLQNFIFFCVVHWELILKMAKKIRKTTSKQIKVQMSDSSVEALIGRRQWPEGGLAQLQQTIRGDMDWVYKMMRTVRGPTNKAQYNRFMNQLSASMYCFSSQGRIAAIEDLKYPQAGALFEDGVVLSTKFKTKAKFGYQPVTLPPDKESTVLMKAYIAFIRPKLMMGPNDPLFINYSGTTQFDVSKGLTNYFSQMLNLHLHTNRMRSIVETEMQDLLEEGSITPMQKLAIENVNGHDSATTRDYYVRKKRKQDAINSLEAFSIFDAKDDNEKDDSIYQDDALLDTLDDKDLFESCLETFLEEEEDPQDAFNSTSGVVGIKHPHYDPTATPLRVPWTDAEIDFVGNWCKTNIEANPAWEKTIVSKCTKYIKSTPAVREIFHPIHITDSTRLRHGLETFNKRQNKI